MTVETEMRLAQMAAQRLTPIVKILQQNAATLTREEWAHVLDLLAYEHECNDNALSKSAMDKLLWAPR
jgi:hypothetical protein